MPLHYTDHPMMTPSPEEAFDPAAPDHPMMTPEPVESFDDNEEYTDTEEGEEEMEEEEDYDINDHDSEIEDSKPIEASPEAKYDEATQQLIAAAEEARKSHRWVCVNIVSN